MCDYFKRLVVYCDGRPSKRSRPRKEDADGAHNQDPPPDDAAEGSTTADGADQGPGCSDGTTQHRSTPRKGDAVLDDAANRALPHQGSTTGLRSFR